MAEGTVYIGQRRSYAGALCTVRYYGPLSGTTGNWLGVEWDDASRGKHDGVHDGQQIFKCLSSATTAASFVRPTRKCDPERTVLEAIKYKYGSSSKASAGDNSIEISGKVVEEVGFDKVQKQISTLTDLRIVLLDGLVVSSVARRDATTQEIELAQTELAQTCPNIVEIDLGWNPIETWQDIADICRPLKKLKILKTSGLRMRAFARPPGSRKHEPPFPHVQELHLNECLIRPTEVLQILSPSRQADFPSLKTLSLSANELDAIEIYEAEEYTHTSVTSLILENNNFTSLASSPGIFSLFPRVDSLSFQGNLISNIGISPKQSSFGQLQTLNLASNNISDYAFIDSLPLVFPNLTSLRVSRNPLYGYRPAKDNSENTSHASAASDSVSFYLTLARISKLTSLNYTNITPREREEGEIYYLSTVEKELRDSLSSGGTIPSSETLSAFKHKHPLYSPLCTKYEREDLLARYAKEAETEASEGTETTASATTTTAYVPGTLGSRLVQACFYIPTPLAPPHGPFSRPMPTTISVYHLKSIIARHFALPPLQFKLTYESHEYDPVEPISSSRNTGYGTGSNEETWDRWGEWDVDSDASMISGNDNHSNNEVRTGSMDGLGGEEKAEEEGQESIPLYMMRNGQRFKKREVEILDGMRAWGDFLDVEQQTHVGARSRGMSKVKVRVEPHVRAQPDGDTR